MKIVFFGTPQFCVPTMKSLSRNFDLVGIVTNLESPIKNAYESLELINKVILTPEKLDNKFIKALKKLDADLFVVASYGKILPSEIIDLPRLGSINVHPSLLPKHRGASPIQTAILSGDKKTGVSIIKMDEKMDHGPILKTFEWEIKKEDTFETLSRILFEKAAFELPKLIKEYSQDKLEMHIQDDSKATYCKTLKKEDGHLDLDSLPNHQKIDRLIRAYYPWPGVWTKYQLAPGKETVVKFLPDKKIQVEGKKPLSYKDFLNGYPLGDSLLSKLGLS